MKRNRMFAWCMALAVLCGNVAFPAHAEIPFSVSAESTEGTYEDLTYQNMGNHIAITKCYQWATSIVFVPDEIDGLPVTVIADGAFQDCKTISGVHLPDTITEIGNEAFSSCIQMKSLNFPEDLQFIGERAFYKCRNLTSATIPAGVTSIGAYAFTESKVQEIKFADGITCIQKHAFSGCAELIGCIMPRTLERIEADAFAECPNLKTVYYTGNSMEWAAVSIGNGNTAISDALVQCGYNTQAIPQENRFVDGRDNWSFLNKDLERYDLNAEDYARLTAGMSEYERTGVDRLLEREYGGSCYGMSVTSMLASAGILAPDFLQADAQSLHEITLDDRIVSAITYYQALQLSNLVNDRIMTDMYYDEQNMTKLLDCVSDGTPTLIIFYGMFDFGIGGHAVVGYGAEYGQWVFDDVTYDGRILIYDNNAGDFQDVNCMYFDSETLEFVIPYYETEAIQLNFVTNDLEFLKYNGLTGTGAVYEATAQRSAILNTAVLPADYALYSLQNTDGAWQRGEAVTDVGTLFTDGTNMKLALPDLQGSYALSYGETQPMDVSISYGNCMLFADAGQAAAVSFSPSGYLEISGENTDYCLEYLCEDMVYDTTWYSLSVQGEDADHISVEDTENGYLLRSDNLRNVTAAAGNDEAEAILTFSTDADSVLLYEVNESTLAAKIDTDGDGTYETKLSSNRSVSLGDINTDGSVDAFDAAKILSAAATVGLGAESGLTAEQESAADVNNDGVFDATDAAKVLEYAAYAGSGGELEFEEYLSQ